MENRVYYGEYSLKHWIDLILKENIILPPYQRYFVWNEGTVKNLIQTFKDKQFVPPVTIGAFENENEKQNLIVDGQQRLTSILLAYLGLYPDKETYKATIKKFQDENNYEYDSEQFDDILSWTFKELLEKRGNNKQNILKNIPRGNYKELNLEIDDNFLENTFLGFSYLVPYSSNETEQQKFYSSVFRHINNQGVELSAQESRKSLYFLNKNLSQFFDPAFCEALEKLDFVRYLSLLSQYKKENKFYNVAKYYAGKIKMETYYEEYIYSIVGEKKSQNFIDFSSVFPDGNYAKDFESLDKTITALEIVKFSSIIDWDLYFFGLIYEIIFEKKTINIEKKRELKEDLDRKILEFKKDPSHTNTPIALKHLRNRIATSIEIYKKYTK